MLSSMHPRKFRQLLETASLTQTEAARLIGMTDRQMRRYVAGDAPVPRVVIYALRYVIAQRKAEASK